MTSCPRCGATIAEGQQTCQQCGTPLTAAAGQAPQVPPPGVGYGQPAGYAQQPAPGYGAPSGATGVQPNLGVTWRSGKVYAARSLELWIIIGLMAFTALYFVFSGLKLVLDLHDLGVSGFSTFLELLIVVLSLSVGVMIAGVALLIHRGDPAARILGWITAAIVVWELITNHPGAWGVLALLASIVYGAGLFVLPVVSEWFDNSPIGRELPVDVAVAWRLTFALGYFLILTAITIFAAAKAVHDTLGDLAGLVGGGGGEIAKAVVYGIILLVAGIAGIVASRMLLDPAAKYTGRIIVSAVAAVGLIVILLQASGLQEFAAPAGVSVAILVALWARPQARAYYDEGRTPSVQPGPNGPYPPA